MTTWQFMVTVARYRPWLFFVNCFIWTTHHSLGTLAFGLIVREFFNALSNGAAAGWNVWSLVALLAVLETSRALWFLAGDWIWHTYWISIEAWLRRNLLDELLKLPAARALKESPGEAVTRFREDVEEVGKYIEQYVDSGGMLLFCLIALAIMFTVSPLITVTVFLPLIVMLGAARLMNPRIRRYRKAMRVATGDVTDFIGEMFGAVQAVKVASAERPVLRRFEELNEVRRKAALKDTLFTQLWTSFNDNVVNVGTGLILLLMAQSLQSGRFAVGDFALFVAYLPRVTSGMSFFGKMLAQHKRTGVSVERMTELIQATSPQPIVRHTPLYLKGELLTVPYHAKTQADNLQELSVKGLTYRHPTSDSGRGIVDVSLSLKHGSFTVITGRIGAGKTTLLRTLLGLLPKDGGEIRWNGQLITDPANFFVPPRSAYTAQVPRLFSDSLRDNVLVGLPPDKVDLSRALRLTIMQHDVADLEKGLDTIVGPRGVRLSGGQIQRTAAARMFVRESELLVFDDLSSALDVDTERQLWERIFEEQVQATCLVVSHRRAALRRADHIIVLKDGRVEDEGPLDYLLANCAEMQRLWNGDFEPQELVDMKL